jgi:hypothetical protein
VPLDSSDACESAVSQLLQWADAQNLTGQQKDQIAAALAQRLGIDYEKLRAARMLHLMNPQEVKDLAADGVDFQLHTHRHRTPLNEALFRQEIRENRVRLASMIGGGQQHFCYPSGAYRPEFLPWLESEGIASAATCDTGLATTEGNPLLLPRLVDTSARTDLEFESWVCGIGHFLSRRKRARLAHPGD